MRDRELRALMAQAKGPPNNVLFRRGVITDDDPCSVALGGGSPYTGVHRLASYTPVVGHDVAVLVFGHDLLILGQIV